MGRSWPQLTTGDCQPIFSSLLSSSPLFCPVLSQLLRSRSLFTPEKWAPHCGDWPSLRTARCLHSRAAFGRYLRELSSKLGQHPPWAPRKYNKTAGSSSWVAHISPVLGYVGFRSLGSHLSAGRRRKDGTLKSPPANCTRNLFWVSLCQTSRWPLTCLIRWVAHISLILGYVGICPHNVRLGETLCHARPHPKLLGDSATSHSPVMLLPSVILMLDTVGSTYPDLCPQYVGIYPSPAASKARYSPACGLLGTASPAAKTLDTPGFTP